MIEAVDQLLTRWAQPIFPDARVSLLPPGRLEGEPGIGLYLTDLIQAPARHDTRAVPLQLTLRYLVTTWHEDPETAHALLGRLLSAASDSNEFSVELHPVPSDVWRAFGVPPQPAFSLKVPLRIERPEPRARPVLRTVEVVNSRLGALSGLLLGPSDVPIANARIELVGCDAKAKTDSKGRFRLDAIPLERQPRRMRIFAKGRTLMVDTTAQQDASQPVIIRLDELEE